MRENIPCLKNHKRYCPVCGPDVITPIKVIKLDTHPDPDAGYSNINWEEVGPRAVLSLVAVLYEKKLYQGKDDRTADREADEEACEMTGLTISQLAELYDMAGLDSSSCMAINDSIKEETNGNA